MVSVGLIPQTDWEESSENSSQHFCRTGRQIRTFSSPDMVLLLGISSNFPASMSSWSCANVRTLGSSESIAAGFEDGADSDTEVDC